MPPRAESHHRQGGECIASVASQSRAAFSATTSNTGWMSVGELAMTPGFRSSRSAAPTTPVEFLEQPHVLDGDHGLVGEGFEQLDLRRGEGAHLDATCVQRSNEFPLLTKGNSQEGAQAADDTHRWKIVLRARRRERGACHARGSSDNCGSSILISPRPMGMGPK